MTEIEMQVNVKLEGKELEQKIHGKMQRALLELMLALEGHAKRLAPVRTGRLRSSIHTTPLRPADKITVADGVDYGAYQEYGTSRFPAHPFLRPARDISLKADLPLIAKKHKL